MLKWIHVVSVCDTHASPDLEQFVLQNVSHISSLVHQVQLCQHTDGAHTCVLEKCKTLINKLSTRAIIKVSRVTVYLDGNLWDSTLMVDTTYRFSLSQDHARYMALKFQTRFTQLDTSQTSPTHDCGRYTSMRSMSLFSEKVIRRHCYKTPPSPCLTVQETWS